MSKALLAVALVFFALPLSSFAQDSPKAEVFGGYSYFRANVGKSSFSSPYGALESVLGGYNLNGWNASVTGNLNDWFGVTGDMSGHYGSPSAFGFRASFVDLSRYTFLFGPRLTARSRGASPFAHFLIGSTHARTSSFGFGFSENALTAAIGGGVDINLSKSLALRGQADYIMTRFDPEDSLLVSPFSASDRQHNLRVSTGVVLRF